MTKAVSVTRVDTAYSGLTQHRVLEAVAEKTYYRKRFANSSLFSGPRAVIAAKLRHTDT